MLAAGQRTEAESCGQQGVSGNGRDDYHRIGDGEPRMTGYLIEWLGTGSGLNPALGNTSFLVTGESERVLLVDCGATVPARLMTTGAISRVTDILITHAHGDHFHGLEALGFMAYFALGKKGERRIRLHFPSSHVAASVRTALEVSMGLIVDDEGNDLHMALMGYFELNTGDRVRIEGLPEVRFVPRKHVGSLENFGLELSGGVFYSGDTVELPPFDARLIFQDCQFYKTGPGDVHISYDRLKSALPPDVRARTHLVHVGAGYDKVDASGDGFGGIVRPGDRFPVSFED